MDNVCEFIGKNLTRSEVIEKGAAIRKKGDSLVWDTAKWFAEDVEKNGLFFPTPKDRLRAAIDAGYENDTGLKSYARVYNLVEDDSSIRALGMYKLVLMLPIVNKNGAEEYRQLALAAQKGGRYVGEFEDYGYGEPWTAPQIQRAVKIACGGLSIEHNDSKSKENELAKSIDNALLVLPQKQRKMVRDAVQREVKSTMKRLRDDFTIAVDNEVQNQLRINYPDERLRLEKLTADASLLERQYKDLYAALSRPITKAEYAVLVQFSHPDKHIGNEDKATRATELVTKLGDKLGYLK